MNKHAYLIIAHDNFLQLRTLLKVLDDSRNDIYLHIDKRSDFTNHDMLLSAVKQGTLYIIQNPINVHWGNYSIVECEMLLLKTAFEKENYMYYHLLSGRCLPLKSQDYLHEFFQSNNGKEFISLDNVDSKSFDYRIKYYFNYLTAIKNPKRKICKAFVYLSMILQRLVGINRVRNDGIIYRKGAQWFSVTNDLVEYILKSEDWIKEKFKNTFCCDEIFMQTLVYNSEFRSKVYHNPHGESNMRHIDWQRGNPYTFNVSDYNELHQSPMLFARKFDQNIDNEIIKMIVDDCRRMKKHN